METASSSDPGGTSSKTTRSSGDGGSSSSGLGALPASLLVHDILLRLDLESLSSPACVSKTLRSSAGHALSSLSPRSSSWTFHRMFELSIAFSPRAEASRASRSTASEWIVAHSKASSGPHIRELNLLRCTAMSPSSVGSIGQKCPNLRVLMLEWAERGSFDEFIGNFHQLLSCCVHLEVIRTDSVPYYTVSLSKKIRGVEDPVYAFSSGIWPKNIKVLKLRPALEDKLVTTIAESMPCLLELELEDRTGIDSQRPGHFPIFSEGCKGIESVRLSGFSEVSDAGFASFFRSCKNLKKFEVHSSRYMSDLAFHDLTEAPRSLTELRIHSCDLITSETVKKLAFCRNLEVLDLLDCRAVADSGLCSLSSLQMLNTLDLPGTAIIITDSGLLTLGQGCAPIRRLSLSYCQGVTDKGIHQLLNSGGIISKTLYRSCFHMTDSSVEALARKGSLEDGSQPIRRLDLFFCIGLSVEPLQMLKRPLFRGLRRPSASATPAWRRKEGVSLCIWQVCQIFTSAQYH
ncbi:hypothetical protein NL676_004452 [Syzygium grande]|nr:hypothetical protein NL676_004452 [Syzygium grande]